MEATPKQYFRGIVKQVLDGATVIIRGQPRNGPPPERILSLSDVEAPRLARRPTLTQAATNDEPMAWEAREFMRKALVGKNVHFSVSHTVPSGRQYGTILFGTDDPETSQDITVLLVSEGLVRIRDNCREIILQADACAKSNMNGLYSGVSTVRENIWEVENPRHLVDAEAGQPIPAIIEHVRDGTTVRAILLPRFIHVTVMMSGIRSPNVKPGKDGKPDPDLSEPLALQAQYYTECRLLQQDVEIILESVSNKNLVGSILHANGNIAEGLLKEGFAKCVDWSLSCVTGGSTAYRAAQAEAKKLGLRIWKDYNEAESGPVIGQKEFSGKVIEIVGGDAIVVRKSKNDVKKLHLASIRPPRLVPPTPTDATLPIARSKNFRPLYDVPFMFEAREFLRKKLIGQVVSVTVDYIQAATNEFNEKTCCTVKIGGVNVAEALVSRGLASVVRYSADNDQRSTAYDDLLAAEGKAEKGSKGMHNKKLAAEGGTKRISDLAGDPTKSRQFLPSLQRAGRISAVVEFVASGSRLRVYIPRESCLITFLLGGISCARSGRTMPSGSVIEAEPFGDEALSYVKEMVLQREVDIEVESMDKGGNFIGYLFVTSENNLNLSVSLVEEGFASAYISSYDSSQYASSILAAESKAQKQKIRRWQNFTINEVTNLNINSDSTDLETFNVNNEYKNELKLGLGVITEVIDMSTKIYAQNEEDGPKLETLMGEMRREFAANPPLAGAFQPKKGVLCAAKFVDGDWYRARVERLTPNEVSVFYIDYGNKGIISRSDCASLTKSCFTDVPPFAKEYCLALCRLPEDDYYKMISFGALKEDLLYRKVKLRFEFRIAGLSPYVSVLDAKSDENLVQNLIADGLLMLDKKDARRLPKLSKVYQDAMTLAMKKHLNIWEYGDITEDDAKEFGVSSRKT